MKIYKDTHNESLMMESINNGSTGDANKTQENVKKMREKSILEEEKRNEELTVKGG